MLLISYKLWQNTHKFCPPFLSKSAPPERIDYPDGPHNLVHTGHTLHLSILTRPSRETTAASNEAGHPTIRRLA